MLMLLINARFQFSIDLDFKINHEDVIDHRSYAQNLSGCEIKAWKNSGLNGIRTHDHCDIGAVLYQLTIKPTMLYQLSYELTNGQLPVSLIAVNRTITDFLDVSRGVTQGSIMGLIFFIMFIIELSYSTILVAGR